MSLTSALNTAKSSLTAVQTQTALVARNIANVNTEGATRKYANVVTGAGGRVEVRSISQATDEVLFGNMLESTSSLHRTNVVQNGLTRINEMIGDIENGRTPAALIGTFSDKLKAYAASPNSYDFARNAADAAADLVSAINQGSQTVDKIRRDADDDLVSAAADMTKILATIEDLNKQIVTAGNSDVTDLVDKRSQAVSELSKYVGINAQTRGNNDLVIYTDSGVTLFDKFARSVSYGGSPSLVDGRPGEGFRIDGVLVTGADAVMPLKSGMLAGLVDLRDNVAVTYQKQLEEIARGLIAATAERPATGGDVPGLFTSVDTKALKTTSKVGIGTFDASKLTAGDTLSFDLTLGATTYKVTGTVPAPTNAADFATWLNGRIAAAIPTTPAGSTTPLGADHATVTATGSALTIAADGIGGQLALNVANISSSVTSGGVTTTHSPAHAGGLVAATATISNEAVPGLARLLTLSPKVAADATAIRDGVNADYNKTAKLAGYTDRINAIATALGASQTYVSGTGAVTSGSLRTLAESSTSWLSDKRSQATKDTEYQQTLLDRTKETLSNETGANIDTESLRMLDLERSYQASSKVLTTVDQMLKTLMDAI